MNKTEKLARIDNLVARLQKMADDSGQVAGVLSDFTGELAAGDSIVLTVDRFEWLLEMAEKAHWGWSTNESEVDELLDQRANLAMLVKRLARIVNETKPHSATANKAIDYLRRHDLLGSPLRTDA